jgi:hydroxyacylglutathione hydrolase
MLDVEIIPCLKDNYSYVIYDQESNLTGVIDPSEFNPIDKFISSKYQKLDYIFNTHHHHDHVGGNIDLKKKYNAKILGSEIDKSRIPGIDVTLGKNENIKLGKTNFEIIFVPGHTKGHIAFYSQENKLIFTGDALFSLGCGRIFEGSAKQMYQSLNKIKNLPGDTRIFCGHEYTKSNLKFCMRFDKKNKDLSKKIKWVNERLNKNIPTVPVSLSRELKTNIFLRCDNVIIKNELKMTNSPDDLIFEKLRNLKDQF